MHPQYPFHAGELEAQRRSGVGGPPGHGIREAMPDQHRAFFQALPYAVLAGLNLAGEPVATLVSGPPGFISAPNPLTLTVAVRNLTNAYQRDLDQGPLRDSAYVYGPRAPRTFLVSLKVGR